MYIARDTFHIQFGAFKNVLPGLRAAINQNLFPMNGTKILTDFTGESYRIIIEMQFNTLADYENMLVNGMKDPAWQAWYEGFKPHVKSSYREILKLIEIGQS